MLMKWNLKTNLPLMIERIMFHFMNLKGQERINRQGIESLVFWFVNDEEIE